MTVNEAERVSESPLPRAKTAGWLSEEIFRWVDSQTGDVAEHCLRLLDPKPEDTILVLGPGAGEVIRRLASVTERVVGVDAGRAFGPPRAATVNRSLPFAAGTFDAVVSTFGVAHAPRPAQVARELARVTKHKGRIALAAWPSEDGAHAMLEAVRSVLPEPPAIPATFFDWGHSSWLETWLGENFDLRFEVGMSPYRVPDGTQPASQIPRTYLATFGRRD